jgi:hypothetical protein
VPNYEIRLSYNWSIGRRKPDAVSETPAGRQPDSSPGSRPTLATLRSPGTTDIRNLHAQCRRQINLVILLIHKDLPNQLRHGKFAERFALPNPGPIIPDGLIFVLKIKTEHLLCFLPGLGVTAGIFPR